MAVRWGLLSTARINDWVLEATRESGALEFVAVGGRDAERAATWAAERGIARSHGSYDELLADPEVEAVYVSVPNGLHTEWAGRALMAGKHVLCEKPVGRDPEALALVAAVAQERGLVLAEAFMYRYHPQTVCARELVAAGEIGEVRHVNACMTFAIQSPDGSDPRLSAELEGGALTDVGCYCLSAMRLFAGEPEEVYARYARGDQEVDMRVSALLRFPGEVDGQFDAGMVLPRRDRLEVVGTEGVLVLRDPWHCRLGEVELIRPRANSYGPPAPGDGTTIVAADANGKLGTSGQLLDAYRLEFEAVSAAIAAGTQPEFAADDALAQARALAAIHQSATTGAPVRLLARSTRTS